MNLPSAKRKLYILSLLLVLIAILPGCGLLKKTTPSGSGGNETKSVITGQPALPKVEIPAPLANREGVVPLKMGVSPLAVTDQVQLKFLIIANNSSDFGLDTWKAVLDRVGAPYDVLLAETTPLTSSSLIDTDGTGKYSAILLSNNSLLYQDASGGYVSAFDGVEWNTLWDYERNYKVRQVSLYTGYGTFPEDYCLRAVSEGGVNATPLNAGLTTAGAAIFTELKTGVQIPITYSYVYRTSIATGTACPTATATSIMTAGGNVLGVTSTTTDGRQRLALTFTSNQYLLQSSLLSMGLVRWASKGVFLGELKHYLNVDVDDYFNITDERLPDGSYVTGGFRMSAQDAYSTNRIQQALRPRYAAGGGAFSVNMAYNADGADLPAARNCPVAGANATADGLTSMTRCVRGNFRWINHTLTHFEVNDPATATAAVVRTEIQQNITDGATLGLLSNNAANRSVLKTGQYSGLGVYNPDPNDEINPPTDYGLMASNPNLLSESKAYGVKYLHGNMSFASQRPSCFNCGIYHPMEPSLMIVPDWPTNIAYMATNPAEEASIYNCYFGPNGTCAYGNLRYWPQDLTYAQIIEAESDIGLQHVTSGSVYSHTLHVGNLREYSPGKNLVYDWIDRIIAKYATYYKTPLRTLVWSNLGQYVEWRTSHFKTLGGTKAVWDRLLNRVTVTSTVDGTLFLSGATVTGAPNESYGGNTISRLTVTAGTPIVLTPAAYVAALGSENYSISVQDLPADSPDPVVEQ